MIELKGITWDHPRGYAPLEALSEHDGVSVKWSRRSLKDFGDFSLAELAERFDLLVWDHPHSGEAASGILRPFDELLPDATLQAIAGEGRTPSFQSYQVDGHQWALPIDAACHVSVCRPDLVGAQPLPQSWDAFEAFVDQLSKEGLQVVTALHPTDANCCFLTLSAQLGDAPSGRQWIRRETVLRVLERLELLFASGPAEALDLNPIQVLERMVKTDTIAYSPFLFGYTDYARERAGGPSLRFGNIPGAHGACLGGAGIGISARCEAPQAAAVYAAYLCSAEVQRGAYVRTGGQPAHEAAFTHPEANAIAGDFFACLRSTPGVGVA